MKPEDFPSENMQLISHRCEQCSRATCRGMKTGTDRLKVRLFFAEIKPLGEYDTPPPSFKVNAKGELYCTKWKEKKDRVQSAAKADPRQQSLFSVAIKCHSTEN